MVTKDKEKSRGNAGEGERLPILVERKLLHFERSGEPLTYETVDLTFLLR